ncbi:MAG: hypothetical protein ACYCYF_07015 [Anaerolineae bacterium]
MVRLIALTLIVALLMAGCVRPAEPTFPVPGGPAGGVEGPALPVDITGNISDVQPGSGDVLGSIRIEGEKIEGNPYDKAVVRITGDTRLWEKTADGYIPATFDDLQFGATVTASFTGPVMESYPVQATAAEVTLLYRMPQQ